MFGTYTAHKLRDSMYYLLDIQRETTLLCLVPDREELLPGLPRQRTTRRQSLLRLLQVLPPQVYLPATLGQTTSLSGPYMSWTPI